MRITIRPFDKGDWNRVAEIYKQGLETGNASFETKVPDYETWMKKFHPHLLWVAVVDGQIAGWAGLQPVSVREAYAGVTEVTIYIDLQYSGRGIGKQLMRHLVEESEGAGIWTLYASIFQENAASIHLHEQAGFREIGYREKIAKLNGQWRNTILFERRSKVVGV